MSIKLLNDIKPYLVLIFRDFLYLRERNYVQCNLAVLRCFYMCISGPYSKRELAYVLSLDK